MACLRVLELYSGIGGMHCALKESGIPFEVVAAIDINTTANEIYKHNFPKTTLWSKTIEGITLEDFNKLSFDMILMSPPCQPFTRIGLQRDIADPRTKSFLYVLDLLPRLKKLPCFILLENVKGFETSCARNHLVKTLLECGYTYEEIMSSPTSVGIPNSRLRYFLIATISAEKNLRQPSEMPAVPCQGEAIEGKKTSDGFSQPAEDDLPVQPEVPTLQSSTTVNPEEEDKGPRFLYKLETVEEIQRKTDQNNDTSVRQIKHFLEPQTEINMEKHLLAPKTLLRYSMLLDIVHPTCRRSVCFTKGYGRYMEGTGSVLQGNTESKMEDVFRGLDQCSEEEKLQRLQTLSLRYFTPREVANLMGFPQSFSFPDHISPKKQYKVLGNSLNVVLVAGLIQRLVFNKCDTAQETSVMSM
ncbi:tRNA (cytosine(38)-C(5))-methyltransferase [Nelusetta ayraudi]|uniref:tRNA (cytosine(38)-C(5))-methyltransferase n=1 Tax=Nelusetta ayraudi TaxID=303726 RepID=UPI003F6F70C4